MPFWSNSLWQGWSYRLVHCPAVNATDPIWRVLASSDGMSTWTPLKPQHSNPNPNPNSLVNQLVYWLPYSSHTSHHPSQTHCLFWISNATHKLIFDSCKMVKSSLKHSIRFCGIFFFKFKTQFYCISFFQSVRLHFKNSPAVTIKL